jgi:energy-coupling factor transporter ATP-binding protein EcfA2
MKMLRAKLKNFCKFEDFECSFDGQITHLVGVNGSGKSTIGLKGLLACVNGISEKSTGGTLLGERFKFIGKNGKSADVEYEFVDDETGNRFAIKNHITNSTNSITFKSLDGSEINDDWLKSFLNIALMSAKNFTQLSGRAQAIALGIDTSSFDTEIKALKEEYTLLNRELKAFGDIQEPEKCDPIDVQDLAARKRKISNELNTLYLKNKEHNKELRKQYVIYCQKAHADNEIFNKEQVEKILNRNRASDCISILKTLGYSGLELDNWFTTIPLPLDQKMSIDVLEPEYIEEMPDDSELKSIDQQIIDANCINEKAGNYKRYFEMNRAKAAKQKKIDINKDKQAEASRCRNSYIASFKFPFAGLTTGDDGSLLLNDRPLNDSYFSKGELEMIVARLHASINPVFKTRFIDDFDLLDEQNQEKLLKELVDAGFQVITAEVRATEKQQLNNVLVLKECKLITGEEEEKPALI